MSVKLIECQRNAILLAPRRSILTEVSGPASIEPLPAIFPGHIAPIVRRAGDGERELNMLSWGFVLLQNGKAPRRVTNVRDDKVLTSRFWRDSFEQRRCLVPARHMALVRIGGR